MTILDANTLHIKDFHYDGGGPGVYFYLGRNNTQAAFEEGLPIGPLLTGTIYNGDDLIIDIPAYINLDDYQAINVWCVDFSVNFGSGTFGAKVKYQVTFNAT